MDKRKEIGLLAVTVIILLCGYNYSISPSYIRLGVDKYAREMWPGTTLMPTSNISITYTGKANGLVRLLIQVNDHESVYHIETESVWHWYLDLSDRMDLTFIEWYRTPDYIEAPYEPEITVLVDRWTRYELNTIQRIFWQFVYSG